MMEARRLKQAAGKRKTIDYSGVELINRINQLIHEKL